MCKYSSTCSLCHYNIEVETLQESTQDVQIKISSECPNLHDMAGKDITLDAMHELIVPKQKSEFYQILKASHQSEECSVYDAVKDAIGKNLARYYELA